MQKFSYHTHTNFSDGRDTIESMLSKASELGFEEIGITDHLVVHKNIKQSVSWGRMSSTYGHWIYKRDFSEAKDAFLKHIDEIRKYAKNYSLKVYAAAEVDFFTYDGWQEEFADFRKNVDLDYYITGNHFLAHHNEQILDPREIDFLSEKEQCISIKKHFETMKTAIGSKSFLFLAHLDYMRRIKFCSDNSFMTEKLDIIRALKENNIPTELSTKGLRKRGDFYPNNMLTDMIIENNIRLVISDDAHRTSELSLDFEKAEQYLLEKNYFARFCIS